MNDIPKAIGPYAAYRRTEDLIITSGQLPLDPATNEFAGLDTYTQAKQSLTNIAAILKSEGSDLDHALKLTVYLKNLADFESVNRAFREMLHAPYPARTAFEVSRLPKDALVEIEAIAALDH